MPTSSSSPNQALVGQVVAEWRERMQRGERFELGEYTAKYPQIAGDLQELFPAIVMIEDLKGEIGDLTGSVGSGTVLPGARQTLERLGDFRILREVGRGGMGIVYEAEQESLGRHVALKVLPVQAMLDAQQQKRFQREAKAAARMHHTNIVPVYGVGEHDGMFYYVMQYIQGLGLDQVLIELKRLNAAKAGTAGKAAEEGREPPAAKDVSAVHVAQSLLTGRFDNPLDLGVEESNKPIAPALTATLTQRSSSAGPPVEVPSSTEKTVPQSSIGSPAPSPPEHSSGNGSKPLSRTRQVENTTLTDSGRHYWRSVARMGLQVAEALDYAHQQGVQHRDIKPSNLLLDTQGTVWVTDFGLAKATAEGDNLTHTGDIVGTLRYMAPERFSGVSDARGDIYSLGLTLYEMVVQQPAFLEKDRNQLIKQVTEAKPVQPRKLNPAIPRDLETIILKATDREPNRRYLTARALAEDLRRFIDDKPILARQASNAERLWRWCRRNPLVASLSAAVLTLLIAVAIGSTVVAFRFESNARQESQLRHAADLARHRAEDAQNQAMQNLEEANRQKQLSDDHLRQARAAVDTSLTKISESKLLNVPGLQPLRKELLDSALQFYEKLLKQRSDDPAVQRDLATAYTRVARITAEIGRKEDALEAYAQALTIRKKLLEADPNNLGLQAEIASQEHATGQLQFKAGDANDALKSLQRAADILRAIIPKSQDKVELLDRFASVHNDIGAVYIRKDERLEAMSYYAAALKLQRQIVDENPKHARASEFRYELANQLNRMGELNSNLGVVAEAAKLHGEALTILKDLAATNASGNLGNDIQRALATSHERIGDVEDLNQETQKAKVAYQLALPIRERLATANPMVTEYQSELAHTYFTLGTLNAKASQLAAAVGLYQRAIDHQRLVTAAAPAEAEPARSLARQLAALGSAQRQLGQRTEAHRSYQDARAVLEKINPPGAADFFELARACAASSLLTGPAKGEPTAAERILQEKDAAQALQALRQAVAGGFREIERLEKDPEFERLRPQKDFQTLVADLRKKIKVLDWHSDIEAAKARAAREKKDLFVYFTGSDWCPWCLLVRREVLGKDAFIDYVPNHFVLVELDFPRQKPKPKEFEQNQALMEKWELEGFPSLILADAQGRPYASLRDGNVRDESTAYVELMEKLRKNRVRRDEFLAKALALEGLQKAQNLDKALDLVPRGFLAGAYPEIVSEILSLDPDNKAGLRSKYLPTVLGRRRVDVQEAMKKQDWDGTILKIDKIIAELKPTGKLAAEVWIDRARAHVKLNHWEQAEKDYNKALEEKSDDPDLLVERGQFYQSRGQSDRALQDFVAAIGLQTKVVEAKRAIFDKAPDVRKNRFELSQAKLKLGEVQRHAGQLAAAAATALDRAKLWPDFFNEAYNVACELALCAPLVGQGGELTAEQQAQRQQYADQAMEWLRRSVLLGYADGRHMKEDTDLDALRDREDYKALERALEPSPFPSVALHSRLLKGHTVPLIECVAISSDGRHVLSSCYDNTVRLWDLETGKELRRLQGHKGIVHNVAFGDRGRRAATAGEDGAVRIWDTETGKELHKLVGHDGPVLGVAMSADGKQALSCGRDKKLILWDIDSGKEVRKLEGHQDAVLAVALSADGRRAVSSGKSVMYYWDVNTGKPLHQFDVPGDNVSSIALSADGRHAAGGSGQGFVYLWDLQERKQIHRLAGHWTLVRGVGFTPDGRQVVAGNIQTGLIVSDVETGRELYRLGVGLPCGGLAVAPNGRFVVSANNDGAVHVWTLRADEVAARNLARTGRDKEAEAAYGALIAAQPKDANLRLERARFYAHEHDWQRATADYDWAIENGIADPDTRLERGRCLAKLGQWEKAASDYDAALSALDSDPNGLARQVKACEEAVQVPELLSRLSASRPKDAQLHLSRGRALARKGQWAEAASAVARSVELRPPADAETWFEHAGLRLLVGDTEGYRVACARLLEAHGKKDSKISGYLLARAGTLAPNAVPDLKLLEHAAEATLDGNQRAYGSLVERAALHYRAGRFDQASPLLRECLVNHPKWNGQVLSWLWLAMVQHKLGQADDARQSMSKADEWFAKNGKAMPATAPGMAPMTLQDWLEAHIIHREAAALIKQSKE